MRIFFKKLLIFALFLVPFPLKAETLVRAVYDASLLGVPLSRTFLITKIEPARYSIELNGRGSKLLSLMSGGKGSAKVQGIVVAGRPQPSRLDVEFTSGKRSYAIGLEFRGASIASETIAPPLEPKPDTVRLNAMMKKNVIDPLSAFLVPVADKPGSVCERSLPIYTGRERFDIQLNPLRSEQVHVPGFYKGEAIVCAARYAPVGGHRAEKPEVKYMIENKEMEAWFIPVPGQNLMTVYRIKIGTKVGDLVVQLERAETGTAPLKP